MFGSSPKNGANAYLKVGMETGVGTADPHKLIVMLFDGAIQAICNGASHMQSGNIPEKGRSISHAIAIIENGLQASLNKRIGGELAQNLDALYSYMGKQLVLANIHNDPARLNEVRTLLSDLREAWEQIAPGKSEPVAIDPQPVALPKDALAPRKSSYVSA